MIKTLGLALYGPLAASTRYRIAQFVPGLSSLGIQLEVRSLLDDRYLRRRFSGASTSVSSVARNYLERLHHLREQDKYDVAMVHIELLPFLPATIEHLLLRIPYIYDLDDAFYLRYKTGKHRILEPILGKKFERIISSAAGITAGNRTLAAYCSQFSDRVTEFPTVLDVERFRPLKNRKRSNFTVGWIGSPSTATYLPALSAVLATLGAEAQLDFIVIGGKAPAIPNVNVIEVPWSEASEVDMINAFDVGLMPLPDDEWARGKCAFKLIQYMACGVPVVASPVGANVDVVTQECGFLASSPEEWVESLRLLRDNSQLRAEMGASGRARVEHRYSLDTAVPKLAAAIETAAKQGAGV